MEEINKLIAGYRKFRSRHILGGDDSFRRLVEEGQSPRVAMIACSDSRVDPSIVTDSGLGELFVIRNVANLVPPYQPDDQTYHGTSAALEFAVQGLNVRHIIVFGHSRCAGIRALVEGRGKGERHSFVHDWMQIASEVRKEIMASHGDAPMEEKAHLCEHKAIEKSLSNLATFPFVQERLERGEIFLHGWHFSLGKGTLHHFDEQAGEWRELA